MSHESSRSPGSDKEKATNSAAMVASALERVSAGCSNLSRNSLDVVRELHAELLYVLLLLTEINKIIKIDFDFDSWKGRLLQLVDVLAILRERLSAQDTDGRDGPPLSQVVEVLNSVVKSVNEMIEVDVKRLIAAIEAADMGSAPSLGSKWLSALPSASTVIPVVAVGGAVAAGVGIAGVAGYAVTQTGTVLIGLAASAASTYISSWMRPTGQ